MFGFADDRTHDRINSRQAVRMLEHEWRNVGDDSNTPTMLCRFAGREHERIDLPKLIRGAGYAARFAFEEFFHGQVRNPFTRKAYLHSFRLFSAWCAARALNLARGTPGDVGRYLDGMAIAPPTRKLHLAALRRFFDELVVRHVIILNPALSVRTERYQVVEGKTPEITIEQARRLLASINTSHVIGLRDRAIIAMLIYTAARVGAVAKLQRRHFYESSDQFVLRFTEKGGKSREIPVRHDLQQFLSAYLDAAKLCDAVADTPLFRSTVRRTKQLTLRGMTAGDMGRMVKRRMRDAGLPARLCPHSFRVYMASEVMWRPAVVLGKSRCLHGWTPHNVEPLQCPQELHQPLVVTPGSLSCFLLDFAVRQRPSLHF